MSDFVETFQLTFECFHGHSARNNGLVNFRDVKFDDASILFNLCSILSNERCIFYSNNMTRLIQTLQCPFWRVWLTCSQYSIILCPKIFAGLEFPFLFVLWSHGKLKKERKRKKRIAQDQRSIMSWANDCSLSDPAVTSFPCFKIIFRFYNDFSYLRIPPPHPPIPNSSDFFSYGNEQGIGGGWVGTGRCLTARQRRDLGEFRLTMSRDFCRKNFPLYKSASSLMWAEPWLLPFCFFL